MLIDLIVDMSCRCSMCYHTLHSRYLFGAVLILKIVLIQQSRILGAQIKALQERRNSFQSYLCQTTLMKGICQVCSHCSFVRGCRIFAFGNHFTVVSIRCNSILFVIVQLVAMRVVQSPHEHCGHPSYPLPTRPPTHLCRARLTFSVNMDVDGCRC